MKQIMQNVSAIKNLTASAATAASWPWICGGSLVWCELHACGALSGTVVRGYNSNQAARFAHLAIVPSRFLLLVAMASNLIGMASTE